MQKYYKTQSIESTLLELPQLTISQFEQSMTEIAFKAKHVLSSPTYIKIETVCYNIISLLLKGELHRVQSKMLFRRVEEMTKKRPYTRKRIQKGRELTEEQAQAILDAKD